MNDKQIGARAHDEAFERQDARSVSSPLVISVPHAGRDYATQSQRRARLSPHAMRIIEDRYADALVAPLVTQGHASIIARTPRAEIDLNRDPRDIDPRVVTGIPHGSPLIQSVKQRGGLGLFPRAAPHAGELWHGRIDWSEAQARIARVHTPYHDAVDALLRAAHLRHGAALLLDVHSMPPLTPDRGHAHPADIVIGDRYGAAAASRLSTLAQAVAHAHGLRAAINHPYAGTYMLERHGRPREGIHAIQIEISRALYLDEDFDQPSTGLIAIQRLLADMARALGDELLGSVWTQAAE